MLSKVSLIAEEPTLMERVALMLHPSYALKGTFPSTLVCCSSVIAVFCLTSATFLRSSLEFFSVDTICAELSVCSHALLHREGGPQDIPL